MNKPSRSPASRSKTLWAAVLVLIVAVLAMGATLIRIQSRPIEPRLVVLPKPNPTPMAHAPAPAPIDQAPEAFKNEALQEVHISAKPRPLLPRNPEPAVARAPARGASVTSADGAMPPASR